jgi:glycosyl transferase family 25
MSLWSSEKVFNDNYDYDKVNFIDHIAWINLDKSTKRHKHMTNLLKNIKVPSTRISAVDGTKGNLRNTMNSLDIKTIYTSNPEIGCTLSHIAVLEMAIQNNWKNYLVVEDDAVWSSNAHKSYELLLQLIQKPHDVIQLGSTYTEYDKQSYKASKAWTTTAYIVQSHYYETLLKNFREGLQNLINTGIGHQYAIDVYMGHLQRKDNWYVIVPSLMIQRPGYSDIEKHVINNGKYFT